MHDPNLLADRVREIAYAIHVYHGHGHLEKVYENALAHRLRKAGYLVQQQMPIKVHDEDGTLIGDYFADLLIDGTLIVELKTVRQIAPEHEAQVLAYLKSTGVEHGLLINFGSYRFQIRKYVWREIKTTENAKNAKYQPVTIQSLDFALMKPSILILHASGTNRDGEAARACELAGGAPEIVHINQLRAGERRFGDYQVLLLPGGFSYGDALCAGAQLALNLLYCCVDIAPCAATCKADA